MHETQIMGCSTSAASKYLPLFPVCVEAPEASQEVVAVLRHSFFSFFVHVQFVPSELQCIHMS